MPHRFVFLSLVACVVAAAPVQAEPWWEPARMSKLDADQKKWLDERKALQDRVDQLLARDYEDRTAMKILYNIFQRDLKVFGDKHEETLGSGALRCDELLASRASSTPP